MKVKLFTHTDLDGVGCSVLFRHIWPRGVHTTYCDYNKVDELVSKFADNPEEVAKYDFIIITDISVNEKVAEKLDHLDANGKINVQLLDHHDTAKWLNKYDWALVNSKLQSAQGHKSSGTSLVVDYLKELGENVTEAVENFAEQVRRYDTWEWDTIYDDDGPKELNDVLYIVGRDIFAANRLTTLEHSDGLELTADEYTLLFYRQKEIKAYIEQKSGELFIHETKFGNAGVVFADTHISELGNELCKRNEDAIDFAIMIDMGTKKISFRTIREDIHLGEVSKELFGGGGHPKAAGARFGSQAVQDFVQALL